jgi:hypothetical protein
MTSMGKIANGALLMMLSEDEVALIKAILTALRGIKIRDIDKALVILSQVERRLQ